MRPFAVLLLMFGFLSSLFGQKPSNSYKTAPIYEDLRKQVLSLKAEQLQTKADQEVLGILMETGYPEAVATLVAIADGSASLYFSNGGGIIGAGQNAKPNEAAKQFVAKASPFLKRLTPSNSFPLPANGCTRFYVVTTKGVLTAEANENELGEGNHELSPLFYAGQTLITEVRLSEEQKKK